jgi:hypothetical protein
VILLIAILVWPVVVLVCALSFRKTIANVLNSADEAEIGPYGLKWRKSSQHDQADTTQRSCSASVKGLSGNRN